KLKNNDGTPSLYYQGNWRDIFQNWEALAMSYPLFVQGMIAKFLNASTIDGYNPYRITSDGIDWELLDPSDPWSNIGYWGDHQIIYLEKLLELSERFFPGNLEKWMLLPIFTYANVPYKHKPYGQLLENPRDTIEFDLQRHEKIEKLENKTGADGKLIMLGDEILKVNFTEKALVPLLSKISNFIPGAGIWINTQRPEWNDANNALVGSGTSMVTLYYMRRYVSFLIGLFEKTKSEKWPVLSEVWEFFKGIDQIVTQNLNLAKIEISGIEQKQLLDKFGLEGSRFRVKVYKGLSGETKHIMKEELIAFMIKVKQFIDSSIVSNQRPDGLYHAYNLISFKGEEISVRNLSEMLEGQVAVLSSGALKPKVAAELLNSLRKSDLYRPDQRSYMLYPDKQLPWFPDKNNLTSSQINRSKLLQELLLNANKQIVVKDIHGICHFNGIINNAETLLKSLNELPGKYQTLVNKETSLILEIYEEVFDHQSFTGRSGSFYKYEGLGCIYWHMVSKLLLAVGENIRFAQKIGEDEAVIDELKKHYAEIREGIGSHKSPAEYGAFPTDPYSHTPSMAGVQQPGMTGQVKEDLLSRWMEMGLEVENGEIRFYPYNIDKIEFTESHSLISALRFQSCFDVEIPQDEKYLAYTFCGVPVFCIPGEENKLDVFTKEGKISMNNELQVNQELSKMVFSRSGDVILIRLTFKPLKS
ncbi:MAG: hypothetical protein JW798_10790, partial [Prolixibacteraceae bacterium]|nr:hypothetical protein [Prolixibacteraceae bacterium]